MSIPLSHFFPIPRLRPSDSHQATAKILKIDTITFAFFWIGFREICRWLNIWRLLYVEWRLFVIFLYYAALSGRLREGDSAQYTQGVACGLI